MAKNYVVDKKKSNAPEKESFFKRTTKFFSDVKNELKLVSWPTKEETIKLTVAVIVFVVIVGAITGGFDFAVEGLMKFITSSRG